MDPGKRKLLEAAGWRIGSAWDFPGPSEEEIACVGRRLAEEHANAETVEWKCEQDRSC